MMLGAPAPRQPRNRFAGLAVDVTYNSGLRRHTNERIRLLADPVVRTHLPRDKMRPDEAGDRNGDRD